MRALQKISGPYEYLRAAVKTLEENLPSKNASFFSYMVKYHSPDKIIENFIKLIHNGNGKFNGNPLFK